MMAVARMPPAEIFETHRKYLFSIAYRMLGSVGDAEDLVQEAYLRWRKVRPEEVESAKAYLATIVTRLAIDHLQSARVRREEYIGPWLPEPVISRDSADDLADSLSMAFLVLLESLSPVERAVYLLREAFDYDYAEIARIVGASEANCRQMLSRARRQVAGRRPRFEAKAEEGERLRTRFLETLATGDLAGLVSVLAEDITAWSDGGGKVNAARLPIHGPDRVARFFLGVVRKTPANFAVRLAVVNGLPGIITYAGRRPYTVVALETGGGRIRAVYTVVNPDKLAHIPPLEAAP